MTKVQLSWNVFDIQTVPQGRSILLWEEDIGFVCAEIRVTKDYKGNLMFFVEPNAVGGYEWDCSLEHPSHWAELPEEPS